jgi:DNA-binding LacI/PurR family transcriptional regulator
MEDFCEVEMNKPLYSADKNILKNGRPVIALLVGSLSSNYHRKILQGVFEAAEELDVNILSFMGGPLKNTNPLTQARDSIFDLVDTKLVDGIIIAGSSHTRFLNDTETAQFIDRFYPFPLSVSIVS